MAVPLLTKEATEAYKKLLERGVPAEDRYKRRRIDNHLGKPLSS